MSNAKRRQRRSNRTPRRPTLEALGIDAVCDRIAEGESLRSISRSLGMNARRVLDWIEADVGRTAQYARAREAQADYFAEEIVELSDMAIGKSSAEVQARRLAVDARKWVASKLLPKKYGDRIATEISGELALLTDDELKREIAHLLAETHAANGAVAGTTTSQERSED
jgi:hypothetical protein